VHSASAADAIAVIGEITGSRPTKSRISPNDSKSSGFTRRNNPSATTW
jgi:hypothetical protein